MDKNELDIEGRIKNLLARQHTLEKLNERVAFIDHDGRMARELTKVKAEIREICALNKVTYSVDLDEVKFAELRKAALLDLNERKNAEAMAPKVERPPQALAGKVKFAVVPKDAPKPPPPPRPPPPPKPEYLPPEAKPGEIPEPARMREDFKYFCKHAITITYRPGMQSKSKTGGAGPFYFNSAQDELWNIVGTLMLTRKIPVRIKLLKARQLGCTTWLLAYWLWLCLTRKNYSVMFIIDKDEHNVTKREMVVRWLADIKKNFQGEFPTLAKKESGVLFLTNGSKIFFESAQSSNPGTSEMIMGLHESEKPKWPNNRAKQVQESVTPGLPFAAYTIHVDESTAVGMDEFYEGWVQAKEQKPGEDSYVLPIFLPWYLSPEYAIAATSSFKYINDDEDLKDSYIDDESGEEVYLSEQGYAEKYGLSPEQILWRRMQIRKTFGGVRSSFDQEYPTTPDHAWRNTSTNFFPKNVLSQMAKAISAPIFRGRIQDKNGNTNFYHPCMFNELTPLLVEDKFGDLKVWQFPVVGMKYYCGADFAEGKTVTSQGEQEQDETVFSIKNEYGVTVALYTSHCKPEEAWMPLVLISRYYNMATVNGERNSIGHTVLSYFVATGYPNNLVNQYPEGRPVVERMWTTVGSNRIELLNKLRSSYSADPRRVFSSHIHDQVEHFINKMVGSRVKPQAANGYHDDCVMAEAHANHCRLWASGGVDHKTPPMVYKEIKAEVKEGFTLLDTDLYAEEY